jgi:carboxynorspermidine decarboxylase
LLTTVLDRFISDGKTVLILDTSVNHHPEVFEYQRKPALLDEDPQGSQSAILAGSTCLAGDLFGEYRFKQLPEVGEKLVFADVGAYSLIKASRFNGYALPAIYLCQQGELSLVKNDDYSDYRRQWCME